MPLVQNIRQVTRGTIALRRRNLNLPQKRNKLLSAELFLRHDKTPFQNGF
jgi:hypothetical protein